MNNTPISPITATTLDHIRRAHLARRLCIADAAASLIATVYFAEVWT